MNIKRKCPQCQHTRQKNRGDKPLSFDTATGVFKCHHCGWSGRESEFTHTAFRKFRKPDYTPQVNENTRLLEWFKGRGIADEVVRRHRVEARDEWMPQTDQTERVLCFPYFRDGEVVNVKYRSVHKEPERDKKFKMEAQAELILYGVDGVNWMEPLIICEGEIDKLSFETAGFTNCVSVPNGTGTNLEILAKYETAFEQCPRFIIAGDSDEPGLKFQAELIRRLGAEKCWRVEYPDGCKDINDVLKAYGVEAVQDVMDNARPVPVEGVFQISDVIGEYMQLYHYGKPKGEYVGWRGLGELYKPRLGTWTVVTGSPNSGKSPFLRAMMVNLAVTAGWKFLIFPPEDCPPPLYYTYLSELYIGLPFDGHSDERMTESEALEAADWVQDRFIVMNPQDTKRSLDDLLKLTKTCIMRHGINSLIIDPYNRLEHYQPNGITQEQYICGQLSRFDSFVKNYDLHGYFVAHPTKLRKGADDTYPVATLYDISGAAHWFNMPDFGISVWRDKGKPGSPLEVHVQKVKNEWCGDLGKTELWFDRATGRFFDDGDIPRRGARADAGKVVQWR